MGYAVKLQAVETRFLFINDMTGDTGTRTGGYTFNPKYPYRYWIYVGYPSNISINNGSGLNSDQYDRFYTNFPGSSNYGIQIFHIHEDISSTPKFANYSTGNYGMTLIFEFKKPIVSVTMLAQCNTSGPVTFNLIKGKFIFAHQTSVNTGYDPAKHGKIIYPQQYPDENNFQGSASGSYISGFAYGVVHKNDIGWICKGQGNYQTVVYQFNFD